MAVDLQGVPDTRPYTYGLTDSAEKYVQFNPPAGYRVRILSLDGDFVANPETNGPVPTAGTGVWTLFAIRTSDTSAGTCSPCDPNTLVVVQNSWPGGTRIHFQRETYQFGLLPQDNKLILKMAIFFNTTNLFIHMEPTVNFVYQFEKIGLQSRRISPYDAQSQKRSLSL